MRYRTTNRYEDIGDGITHVILKCGTIYKIDTADRAIVEQFTWHKNDERYGYATTNVPAGSGKYVRVRLHRLLCSVTPDRPFVDHVNGDVFDNRRMNLRPCTRAENNMNKKRYRNNKTETKGVFLRARSGKFEATVGVNGKQHYIGSFHRAEDAAAAVRQARSLMHGQFARHA